MDPKICLICQQQGISKKEMITKTPTINHYYRIQAVDWHFTKFEMFSTRIYGGRGNIMKIIAYILTWWYYKINSYFKK